MKTEQTFLLFEDLLLDFIKDLKPSPLYNDAKPRQAWDDQRENIYLQLLSYEASLEAYNVREEGGSFFELGVESWLNATKKEKNFGFDMFSGLSPDNVVFIFNTLKRILSQDYVPLFAPSAIYADLISIYFYYCFMTLAPPETRSSVPSHFIFKIDSETTRIIEKVAVMAMHHRKHGYDQERIAKGDKEKKRKRASRKALVMEKYQKMKRKDTLTDHGIATIIQDQLKREGTLIRSVNTIKEYIKEGDLD